MDDQGLEYQKLVRDVTAQRTLLHAIKGDVWVFAYGSLMWNPGFDYLERRTASGAVMCRTFVANPAHKDYAGRLSEDRIVRMIRSGVGISGTNRVYLENTVTHLDNLGIGDRRLRRLLNLVNGFE